MRSLFCLRIMKASRLLFFGILFAFSCRDDSDPRTKEFTVIVEQTNDISCHLPVIRFLDREDEVRAKTKKETLSYNAYELEKSLNVIGNELIIEFGKVQEEDFRACLAIGISYPEIAILKARLKE